MITVNKFRDIASRVALLTLIFGLTAGWLCAGEPVSTDVFVSGADGYGLYRIPAIEAAPDGTLIAFAEARKFGDDPGFGKEDIDLVYKLSHDSGKTWSPMNILDNPGEQWAAANPCTLVDRDMGRVWVLYLRSEPQRSTVTSRPKTRDMMTFARYSDDNGKTWSEPIDLTDVARDMNDERWRASVVGPGGGIQTRSGLLMAPIWGSTTDLGPDLNLVIFSSDHGKTWQRGKPVPLSCGGDENQLVELADGNILMDFRQNKQNQGHRWMSISSDGGKNWEKPYPGVAVSPVACAVERYSLHSAGDDKNRIIWTGPTVPERNNLVLKISYDEGKTFTDKRLIAEGPAAYSDLTMMKDRSVGVLWERGHYKFITFTRLDNEFVEGQR